MRVSILALQENETKYNATVLLDHETSYDDDAMHHAIDWDWNRNSSHIGLIEVTSMSPNPAHLRDKVGRARDDDSDMKRLYYLLRIIRNPTTTIFHRSSTHTTIVRNLYNGILRLGLQQKEIHLPLVALMHLLRQTRQAVR